MLKRHFFATILMQLLKQHSQLFWGVSVSFSVFVGLISTNITNQFLNVLVYSCREFQILQEYTKIFKNHLIISVNIKPSKTETTTATPQNRCEYSINYLKKFESSWIKRFFGGFLKNYNLDQHKTNKFGINDIENLNITFLIQLYEIIY